MSSLGPAQYCRHCGAGIYKDSNLVEKKRYSKKYDKPIPVFFHEACAKLYRKELFKKIVTGGAW